MDTTKQAIRDYAIERLDEVLNDADALAPTIGPDGAHVEIEIKLTISDGSATATVPANIDAYIADGRWHHDIRLAVA